MDEKLISNAEAIAKKRLAKYMDKIIWIKKKSADALIDVPEQLDFVYIDGNHEYNFVKQDVENYWQKVKKGGIIGGHDMDNGLESAHDGVVKAVIEFTQNKKLHIADPDWWIIKEQ